MTQTQLYGLTGEDLQNYLQGSIASFRQKEELLRKQEELLKQYQVNAENESGQTKSYEHFMVAAIVVIVLFGIVCFMSFALALLVGIIGFILIFYFYTQSAKNNSGAVGRILAKYKNSSEYTELMRAISNLEQSTEYHDAILLPTDYHNSYMVTELYNLMSRSLGFNNLQMTLAKLREYKDSERRFKEAQAESKKQHIEMIEAQRRVEDAVRRGNEQSASYSRALLRQAEKSYYLAQDEAYKREQEFKQIESWYYNGY